MSKCDHVGLAGQDLLLLIYCTVGHWHWRADAKGVTPFRSHSRCGKVKPGVYFYWLVPGRASIYSTSIRVGGCGLFY